MDHVLRLSHTSPDREPSFSSGCKKGLEMGMPSRPRWIITRSESGKRPGEGEDSGEWMGGWWGPETVSKGCGYKFSWLLPQEMRVSSDSPIQRKPEIWILKKWHCLIFKYSKEIKPVNPKGNLGEGSLACCSWWGCKESDTTEQLNNNEIFHVIQTFLKILYRTRQ